MLINPPAELALLNKIERGHILVFVPDTAQRHVREVLDSFKPDSGSSFHLFFGPEGGFTGEEVEVISRSGGVPVSLGPLVMKSETAAIVGTSFIRFYIEGARQRER